jgi:thioredoxin reductase
VSQPLPVVIIGAGPVGLAAAAHVLSRSLTPLVLEAGAGPGAGMRRWGHVRMFSPWKYAVDTAAAALLERHGWVRPDGEAYPTGHDVVDRYLEPLAALPELAPHVVFDARVVAVSRVDHDLMKDAERAAAPFLVRVAGPDGERDIVARAVIDASGTIEHPGALGSSGLPARGERAAADRIFYGIPDVRGVDRERYRGRRVLVVGSGHSALNALLDLAQLAEDDTTTHVTWAIRRDSIGSLLGGARADQLAERGRLGARVRRLLDAGRLELVTGFRCDAVSQRPDGLVVSAGTRDLAPVDEIIAATGFRPDWSILAEVRLDLDAAVQSPKALAPLIDPNVHSCGTVRPHGAEELKHPDANLFAIGMKSYGRAPTFLLLTGYEQARSVVSAIAGDWEAARRVELQLPETGACSLDGAAGSGVEAEVAAGAGTGGGGCCGPVAVPVAVSVGRAARATAPVAQAGCCS